MGKDYPQYVIEWKLDDWRWEITKLGTFHMDLIGEYKHFVLKKIPAGTKELLVRVGVRRNNTDEIRIRSEPVKFIMK